MSSQPDQWYSCSENCDGFGCAISFTEKLPLDVLDVIGHGRFGLVKKVQSATTGQLYALKEIRWNFDEKKKLEVIQKEIETHRRLSQQHVTSLRGSFTRANTSCGILIQPVADCDLSVFFDAIVEKQRVEQPLDDELALLQDAFGCLSSGLAYLHDEKVKHKDIKPGNILVHQRTVLFTDFGLSTDFLVSGQSTSSGPTEFSREWAAPEVLQDESTRNTSSDVFSLCCVFLAIFTLLPAARSPRDFMRRRRDDLQPASRMTAAKTATWAQEIAPALRDHRRELLWTMNATVLTDPRQRPSARAMWHVASTTPRSGDADARRFCGACCGDSYDASEKVKRDAEHSRALAALIRREKELSEELEAKKSLLEELKQRGQYDAISQIRRDGLVGPALEKATTGVAVATEQLEFERAVPGEGEGSAVATSNGSAKKEEKRARQKATKAPEREAQMVNEIATHTAKNVVNFADENKTVRYHTGYENLRHQSAELPIREFDDNVAEHLKRKEDTCPSDQKPPNPFSSGQTVSFKTNVNRKKTEKWVTAKVFSYDGNDWGEFDEDDEYGIAAYASQNPQPPIGLRQRSQSAEQAGGGL